MNEYYNIIRLRNNMYFYMYMIIYYIVDSNKFKNVFNITSVWKYINIVL